MIDNRSLRSLLVMICHSRISHITCAGKHFHQWKVHKLRFHIHVTPLPLNMEFHHQNISKHVPNTRAVQSARLKGEIHTVRRMRSSLRAFGSPTAQHITTMPKALRRCMCLKLDGLWEPMGLCLHTNMSTSSYMPDQYWLIIWSVTDFWAPKPEELGNPELPPTWKKMGSETGAGGHWGLLHDLRVIHHCEVSWVQIINLKKWKSIHNWISYGFYLSPLRSLGKRNVRSKFCA